MDHLLRNRTPSTWAAAFALAVSLGLPHPVAHAEGTAQLGTSQSLRGGTVLGVDIVDPVLETLLWTGVGSVSVVGPSGESLGTFAAGVAIPCTDGAGVYTLTVHSNQTIGSPWDVTVVGAADPSGRLFSTNWQFNAGSFSQSAATNASFYALVPGGNDQNASVIELKLDGLAGYIYDVNANSVGVDGASAGRSVPESGNSTTPEYAIYLQPPAKADYESATPGVYGLDYVGGVDTDVDGGAITPCTQILPGESRGYFYFNSVTSGSYHLQCDLDGDGDYEIGSGEDLLLIGAAEEGTNVVSWDGTHNGANVAPGSYDCRVRVTVGEFHYVGRDIETSYPGMRMFRVNSDGSRTGLAMYWNDVRVQGNATTMPNGAVGLESSEGAVDAGDYADPAVANVNARSWGNFTSGTKGNVAYLDTYVWLSESTSNLIEVTATDDADSDGDGLSDYEEECLVGSDPDDADSDDDGTPDGEQYAVPASSAFSGLESNGRLSSALARRAIRRTRMSFHPNPIASIELALEDEGLARWFPDTLDAARRVAATPGDLPGITNALEVAGTDYLSDDGTPVAGALLIVTAGEFYEHQKAVCDRVKGARLLDVRPTELHGQRIFESTVAQLETGRLEYALSTYLVENAQDDTWQPHSMWVREQAPEVEEGARVVTLQVWGRTPETTRALAEAILDHAAREQPIEWPKVAPVLDDAEYAAHPPAPAAKALPAPGALVRQALTLGGHVDLDLVRRAGGGPVSVRVVALDEDGSTDRVESFDVPFEGVSSHPSLDLDPFLDATVDLMVGGETVDRVWISDGAWAPYDDGIYAGDLDVGDFSRSDCRARSLGGWDEAKGMQGVHLAGCASTKRAGGGSGSGLSRHLTRPLPLTRHAGVAFYVQVDQPYEVCADGTEGHVCVPMPAAPKGGYQAIPMEAFAGVTSADLFTFAARGDAPTRMEVSALTLLEEGDLDTREKAASGCAVLPAGAGGAWGSLPWLLAAIGLGRRRRD